MNAPNVADVVEMVAGAEPVAEAMPPREPRPPKPPREPREARPPREPREPRESRESREAVAMPPLVVDQALPASLADTQPLPQVAAYEPPPAPEPVPQPVARPAVPDLPPIALALPPDSDLVLVETSHHAPAPSVEEPATPRPKRVRPPKVVIADEPLEIIETRKEPSPPAG